jgi:hypothetical protein
MEDSPDWEHLATLEPRWWIQAHYDAIAQRDELLEALRVAVRQNSHGMLMTGEELRACEAAIAKATGEKS